MRDFEFNEKQIESERQERTELNEKLKKQTVSLSCSIGGAVVARDRSSAWFSNCGVHVVSSQASLLRWLKLNLSEAFIAWAHLKALRVHTEAILTYGLPVNYRAMLIKVRARWRARRSERAKG